MRLTFGIVWIERQNFLELVSGFELRSWELLFSVIIRASKISSVSQNFVCFSVEFWGKFVNFS